MEPNKRTNPPEKDLKKMSVGSRHQPSSTVDALLTGAIARVKTEADEAIAKVKAEADEVVTRFKVGTKEKARTSTEREAKVKPSSKVEALLLEAVAKQKAKSEAEIAKAIAKVKAEAEAKAKTYTDTKARVKAEAKEASAKQKTKSEAETTKATARVKAKEKAKTSTARPSSPKSDTTAKVKPSSKVGALFLEAVAKQKAKSEAEIARAIAKVKAEAKEASAKQKTKSEADTTKAIASLKPSSRVEALLSDAVAKQKAQSEAEIAKAIDRLKAETEKAIAKQKAKSEAETTEAIARVKAETEEETRAYMARLSSPKSDVIANVRAEAEETIAEQKTKSEAEAADAIAKVKAEAIKAIAKVQAKAEEEATVYTVTIAKVRDGEKAAATVESKEQPICETLQRMPQSLTVLPDEHFLTDSGTPLCDLLQNGNIALSAKDIMQKELIWGSADDSVQQTFTKMQQYNAGYVMIGRDGVLEGIVSKSDITGATSPYLQPVFARWRQFLDDATLQIRIRWIMSRPVHIISPQTSLAGLMRHMCRSRRLCLPVVDQQSKVLGLVTEANILQALLQLQSSPGVSTSGEVAQVKSASGHAPHDSTTQASRTMETSPVQSQ